MKKYIKPSSAEITLQTEDCLLTVSDATNHKYVSDGKDEDYGTVFSNKKGWSSDSWSDTEE